MNSWRRYILRTTLLCFLFTHVSPSHADLKDPLDTFDQLPDEEKSEDDTKSAQELLHEAQQLLSDDSPRPLDARTILLKLLKREPKNFEAHILLAEYYMQFVGHFRLAMKYVKRAEQILGEGAGQPPYENVLVRAQHQILLDALAQARLNLDDYKGALDALDEVQKWGYIDPNYPATRAWVLMKLGRLDEAIRIARLGASFYPEGRILNMLGILLSMKGEPESALRIFNQAVSWETLRGKGRPATPLNNSGEVYRELFEDDKAEGSWTLAKTMPDGCEHVLPSLNLALLYIEQANFAGAKRSMDTFESCVAQYALRNGEEHAALVHLARGRIALHSGDISSAITHIEQSLQNVQWFGKIGTNQEDLTAAAYASMSHALQAQGELLKSTHPTSLMHRLSLMKARATSALRAWWSARRARQILFEQLNDFEDIKIRHTDSLLEYPTLGSVLRDVSPFLLQRRIDKELDRRPPAHTYYNAYLAESSLAQGRKAEGQKLMQEVLRTLRPKYDEFLRFHVLALQLKEIDFKSPEYQRIVSEIFEKAPALVRNYGLSLPVQFEGDREAFAAVEEYSPFKFSERRDRGFVLQGERVEEGYLLRFRRTSGGESVTVKGASLPEIINELTGSVFRDNLKD